MTSSIRDLTSSQVQHEGHPPGQSAESVLLGYASGAALLLAHAPLWSHLAQPPEGQEGSSYESGQDSLLGPAGSGLHREKRPG